MENSQETFISAHEKEIWLLKYKGNSSSAIAARYGSSAREIQKTYDATVAKLQQLEETALESSPAFPCLTIADFLDQIELDRKFLGREEMAEGIRVSYKQPELLDSLADSFYPLVAEHLCCPEKLVKSRIYYALARIYRKSDDPDSPIYIFFRINELDKKQHRDIKQFFLATHDCITELHYAYPAVKKSQR